MSDPHHYHQHHQHHTNNSSSANNSNSTNRQLPMEMHSLEEHDANEDIKVEDFLELLTALQSVPPIHFPEDVYPIVRRGGESVVATTTATAAVVTSMPPKQQQPAQPPQPQPQRPKRAESDALRNVQDAPRTVGQTNDKTVRRKKEQLLTVFAEFVNLVTLVNQQQSNTSSSNNNGNINNNSRQDGSTPVVPRHEAVLVIMNQVKDPPTCGGRNTTDELLRRDKVELIAMGAGSGTSSLKRIVQHLNWAEDPDVKDQYDIQVLLHNAQSDIRTSTKEYIATKSQKRRRGKRGEKATKTTAKAAAITATSETDVAEYGSNSGGIHHMKDSTVSSAHASISRSFFEEVDCAGSSSSSYDEFADDLVATTASTTSSNMCMLSSPRKRKSF